MIAEYLNIPKTELLRIVKEDFCSPPSCKCLTVFDEKKSYNPLSPPVLSRFISADYFLFPKLIMKLYGLHFADVADIQEPVTDELNKVKKRNFRQLFRNRTTAQKPVYTYMPLEPIFY
jgi:hypothetical protein